jgi:pyruvate kinase
MSIYSQRVLDIAKEKNWVKPGDYIVVSFGDIEGVAGTTNSLKIIKVE